MRRIMKAQTSNDRTLKVVLERRNTDKKSRHILLEFPFTVIQRTDISSFQPTRDAMKMEGVL